MERCVEKILTIADVESKLIVPMDCLDNLFPVPVPGSSEAIPIPIKDDSGKDYTFRLKVRSPKPGELRYYMKPEFMFKEWQAFVVEKKLQVGERIFLWRDVQGRIIIKVRVPPRRYRLLGTTFLY